MSLEHEAYTGSLQEGGPTPQAISGPTPNPPTLALFKEPARPSRRAEPSREDQPAPSREGTCHLVLLLCPVA